MCLGWLQTTVSADSMQALKPFHHPTRSAFVRDLSLFHVAVVYCVVGVLWMLLRATVGTAVLVVVLVLRVVIRFLWPWYSCTLRLAGATGQGTPPVGLSFLPIAGKTVDPKP